MAITSFIQQNGFLRKVLPSWLRSHPFDIRYGTKTNGFVPARRIHHDKSLTRLINPYAASQPSIVHRAFSALVDMEDYALIDMGCGKGRALLVGGAFPFRRIIGVELSEQLVEIARANIVAMSEHNPRCATITVENQNVLDFVPPSGNLVIFIYHSFGRELMSRVLKKLESLLESNAADHIFIVYYNPVYGDLIDSSLAFTRWYAETIPYDSSELGYGPDKDDVVVIWQSTHRARLTPHKDIHRRIINTSRLDRAHLE